jgi:hypothetical protein
MGAVEPVKKRIAYSTTTLTQCLPSQDFSAELPLPLPDALFEVSGYNHSFGLCLLRETTERPMLGTLHTWIHLQGTAC